MVKPAHVQLQHTQHGAPLLVAEGVKQHRQGITQNRLDRKFLTNLQMRIAWLLCCAGAWLKCLAYAPIPKPCTPMAASVPDPYCTSN
jgi:hypothetical protein